MAIVMGSKLISPYLLGWLADYFQKTLVIIQIALLLSIIIFIGVIPFQSYSWFVAIMALFGFFWNASLPLYESLTLSYLAGNTHRYSHVRLWGSIGFILVVMVLPFWIKENGISLLPWLILSLLIGNGLSTLFIKDQINKEEITTPLQVFNIVKHPIVIAFLAVCALQTLSHGAYYTFFSIYLEDHHYSRSMIGIMWGLGVIAEVILFMAVHKLIVATGVYVLFILSLFLTSLRWVILAFWVDSLSLLIMAQLLHAASFGLFHATAIHITHQLFPHRLQARGQALYAGVSFGFGGALGNWLSGHSWDTLGSTWTLLASSAVALLGALIALRTIKHENLPAYAKK